MNKSKIEMVEAGELRRRAEERFGAHHADAIPPKTNTPSETQRLLHELQVHQIELERQNDELRRTQIELQTAHDTKPFAQHELGVAVRVALGQTASALPAEDPAHGRRALVVDDDPDVAETMGDALEQSGLPATIARTGAEAIRIAGEVRPVLVFAMSCSARGCRATTSRAPCAPIRGCATPR